MLQGYSISHAEAMKVDITVSLGERFYAQLEDYAKKTRRKKSSVVEEALERFFD